jgi:3-oxoacyl-(acyl-carrier-protein) synthase
MPINDVRSVTLCVATFVAAAPFRNQLHFAQQHAVEGSVLHVSAASVSGAVAIIEGARLIRTGAAKLVVVGAADCPLQPEIIERFRAAGLLAQRHCQPYSRHRTGTLLAEAAGGLILEAASHAAARGACVYGRLCAAEMTTESHAAAAPDPTGVGWRAPLRKFWQRSTRRRLSGSRDTALEPSKAMPQSAPASIQCSETDCAEFR